MKNTFLVALLTLFLSNHSFGQWTKVTAIPDQDIVALAVLGDTLFAASDTNVIFRSVDGGLNWNPITVTNNGTNIIALKVIGTKIYIGTIDDGIFTSTDFGLTWQNSGTGLFAISGFESKGTDEYASTFGNGVVIFNQSVNNWIPMNDSLPSYSFNVNFILYTLNSLLIAAGANGTFYRFDYGLNYWKEEYYYGSLAPGLQIDKLISNLDTILAVNGNHIIRSENDGLSWTDDKTGAHNGFDRNIYKGTNLYYTLTNLPGGTWIQQRNKFSGAGATWDVNEELLAGYSYDILEYKSVLFLGKDDGLYMNASGLGIDPLLKDDYHVKIYADPYNASVVNVSSDFQVEKITIKNTLGQISWSENIGRKEFAIQPKLAKGIYFVSLTLANGQDIARKIIMK